MFCAAAAAAAAAAAVAAASIIFISMNLGNKRGSGLVRFVINQNKMLLGES